MAATFSTTDTTTPEDEVPPVDTPQSAKTPEGTPQDEGAPVSTPPGADNSPQDEPQQQPAVSRRKSSLINHIFMNEIKS